MSSPAGEGGELRGRSLQDLQEMLRHQERVLAARTFIYRLPDKGKKISDFVEKLKLARAQQEELRRTTELLSVVRLAFQTKQEEINTNKQRVALSENKSTNKVFSSIYENSATHVNKTSTTVLQDKEDECTERRDTRTASAKGHKKLDQIECMIEDHAKSHESESNLNSSTISLMKIDQQIPKYSSLGETESAVDASGNSGDMLVDAFETVAVGDGNNNERKSEKEQNINLGGGARGGLGYFYYLPFYGSTLQERKQLPAEPAPLPSRSGRAHRTCQLRAQLRSKEPGNSQPLMLWKLLISCSFHFAAWPTPGADLTGAIQDPFEGMGIFPLTSGALGQAPGELHVMGNVINPAQPTSAPGKFR
uniref:Uncharacterized protein n=1 Tax=Chelydra serpentina TaxID=8475 RepID=A0A8C3TBC2_CHESE